MLDMNHTSGDSKYLSGGKGLYNRFKQLPIRSPKILIGVFMMVALVALAACGGDDDERGPRIAVALVGTAEAFTSTVRISMATELQMKVPVSRST